MKSGVLRKGDWFANEYPKGWYFYTVKHELLGPYKKFDDGVKDLKKHL